MLAASSATSATSMVPSSAAPAAIAGGASSAAAWLFTELSPASQWALHSCGCSGSMRAGMAPSQSGMAAISAASPAGAGASCGQA